MAIHGSKSEDHRYMIWFFFFLPKIYDLLLPYFPLLPFFHCYSYNSNILLL